MKKISILLVALCTMGAANAQKKQDFTLIKDGKATSKFKKHVQQLLSGQMLQQQVAQKPTAIGHRLIGIARQDGASIAWDSTALKYSGTNGSVHDYNYMRYQIGTNSFGFNPSYYPYDFSRIPVKSDSAWYWEYNGSNYQPSEYYYANHLSNGSLSTMQTMYFDNGAPDGSDKYINVFNLQGKLQRMLAFEDVGGGNYDSIGKMEYKYDNLGNKIVKDSLFDYNAGDWDLTLVIHYTYSSSGTLDSMIFFEDAGAAGWQPSMGYVHLFDNNQRLIRVVGLQDMGTGLTPVVLDTFEYAGNLPYFKKLTEYTLDISTSAFVPNSLIEKHINGSNLPDTMYVCLYNGASWDTSNMMSYQYDANNNVETVNVFSGVETTAALSLISKTKYYYESYTYTPSQVATIVPRAAMTVFPNPTNGAITLQWKQADSKRYQIEMVNATGQKIMTQSFLWKEQQQTLSLASLPTGMYWIAVRNQEGAIIFHTAVQKQ